MLLQISRNRIVQIPENMIARLGSSPMTRGNTKVAPNIATTCWAPSPTILPHGSLSSGATGSPGAGVTTRQLNIVDIWILLVVREPTTRCGDPHHTPRGQDFCGGTPYAGRDRAAGAATSSR